jgi:uncharacterized protein YjiS (DUF1127 family)
MRLLERWEARARRRGAARVLGELDPHLLRDIGFDHLPNRAEIARVLREGRIRRT